MTTVTLDTNIVPGHRIVSAAPACQFDFAVVSVTEREPLPVLKAMGGWLSWKATEIYQHINDQAKREATARVIIGPRSAKVLPLSRRRTGH